MSEIPKGFEEVKKKDSKMSDAELLRIGIIAELDAINLYEQLAARANEENIRKVFLDIAKEEKTHVGEFLALLLKIDKEQVKELEKGKKEVEEITE
jgi:rubrerythrin